MEFLISRGHPPEAVFKYSLRQFRTFLSLAVERDNKESFALASLNRMAYHATVEDWKSLQKEIGA